MCYTVYSSTASDSSSAVSGHLLVGSSIFITAAFLSLLFSQLWASAGLLAGSAPHYLFASGCRVCTARIIFRMNSALGTPGRRQTALVNNAVSVIDSYPNVELTTMPFLGAGQPVKMFYAVKGISVSFFASADSLLSLSA